MPRLTPLKPGRVIKKLRKAGFEGPFGGGKHCFMRNPTTGKKISIPIHKGKDIPVDTIRAIIRQADLTVDKWNEL